MHVKALLCAAGRYRHRTQALVWAGMGEHGRWCSVELPSQDALCLDLTLSCGQAFRWVRTGGGACAGAATSTSRVLEIASEPVPLVVDGNVKSGHWTEWTGTIGERLFTLIQLHSTLYYYTHPPFAPLPSPSSPISSEVQDRETVVSYFRISEDLAALYQQWGEKDTNFRERAANCKGVRLLQQDPFEALIAFICSSNNNIPRITLMLSKLCQRFGHCVGRYKERDYFNFPSVESLAKEECEQVLRQLGFGYRAKYVHQTAQMIVGKHGGVKWLDCLRGKPYWEAWEALQCLAGVGGKVADCVCLMGLDHMEAVPVDTHVWRVAVRDYGVSGQGSTLTSRRYREVGDLFRSTFGEKAGWAQTVLFTAELQRSTQPPGPLPSPTSTTPSKKKRQTGEAHISTETCRRHSKLPRR